MDWSPPASSVHEDSPGKNTGVGCHALLQGIFPTQGSNPGLLYHRWTLYCLSHHGSPRILEWVVYPFARGSSQPRNRTGVLCIAGGFFTNWFIKEAHEQGCLWQIRFFSLHYLLIANIIPVQIAFFKDSFCLRNLLILSTALLGIKKNYLWKDLELIKHNKCYICVPINSCLLTDLPYFLILDCYLSCFQTFEGKCSVCI